jgi:hypothetical protein
MSLPQLSKRPFRRYAPTILALVIILSAVGFLIWKHGSLGVETWAALISFIIGSLSVLYLVQSQRIEEARLFKELFSEFNARYNKLNEGLNEIHGLLEDAMLSYHQRNRLYDYFNLCAEEYLFYRRGYILPQVWDSWLNGMRFYYKHRVIADLWELELNQESYYGFPGHLLRQTDT